MCSGTPVGPTPSPRPRRAQRWPHRAAHCGEIRQSPNRPIARRIRRRRERPDQPLLQPLEVRRFRFGDRRSAAAESPPSAVQGHAAARGRLWWPIGGHRRAAAARRRRGRAELPRVTLRCAAQPTEPHSRTRAGGRRSNSRNGAGSSRSTRWRRRRCTNRPARHLRPATHRFVPLPPRRHVPTDRPPALAVGVRR